MSNCPTASRWIKFANSLRLRLAMRVSNVNKALAASEAKKALENSYGVIESSAENIQISGKGYQNPLAGVAGWGETYMGATMASVLNGYEDPRISIYYSPATLADHTEEYLGVPQGVYAKDGDPNYYQSYSFINTKNNRRIHTRRSSDSSGSLAPTCRSIFTRYQSEKRKCKAMLRNRCSSFIRPMGRRRCKTLSGKQRQTDGLH